MNKQEVKGISIYLQVSAAVMMILFSHYIVRALPGALSFGGPASIIVPILTTLLFVGIILVLFRKKWGLIFGFLNGAYMIFQPIYVHIIKGLPDKNGIWWYPVLPWSISLLIIYFCNLSWKNWDK